MKTKRYLGQIQHATCLNQSRFFFLSLVRTGELAFLFGMLIVETGEKILQEDI